MGKLKNDLERAILNFSEVKAFSSRYAKPEEFGVRGHSIFATKEGDKVKIEQGFELKHYIDPELFIEKIMASLNKTGIMERRFKNPKITSDVIYATNNKDTYWWVRFIILVDWS